MEFHDYCRNLCARHAEGSRRRCSRLSADKLCVARRQTASFRRVPARCASHRGGRRFARLARLEGAARRRHRRVVGVIERAQFRLQTDRIRAPLDGPRFGRFYVKIVEFNLDVCVARVHTICCILRIE